MHATITSADGSVIEVTNPGLDACAATQPFAGLTTAMSAVLRYIARGRAPAQLHRVPKTHRNRRDGDNHGKHE